ncbi:MAG: adenine phosphoribosyltransferase [Gammaproteobacteria bacterium]|nr:adenine phosphoribosyltransferase [Gammaproteobacteria bacterium]
MQKIQDAIRNIPDFPKAGIQFKDISPLLKNPLLLNKAVELLVDPFRSKKISAVAGMEARGFIFGSLAAAKLDAGFIPLRKPGKLPYKVNSSSYELEYGSASLEIHSDALSSGDRVLIVDDLIATGGTALASCELVSGLQAEVVACAFLIELDGLGGREKLRDYPVHSIIHY